MIRLRPKTFYRRPHSSIKDEEYRCEDSASFPHEEHIYKSSIIKRVKIRAHRRFPPSWREEDPALIHPGGVWFIKPAPKEVMTVFLRPYQFRKVAATQYLRFNEYGEDS